MTKMHILKKSFIDILSKYVCACYVLGARDIVVIELVMVHTQKELTVSWRTVGVGVAMRSLLSWEDGGPGYLG